jgi:hypothetical protein
MVDVILADKPGSSYCSRMQCAPDNDKVHIYFEVFLFSADPYIICLDMTLKCCLCPS